jgi:hypothetical protein
MNDAEVVKDLLKEKRLWDIYVASRRIPFSRFNFWTTFLVACGLTLNVILVLQPLDATLLITREASADGLAMALSTLGFLVAGFTIFATITQPDLSLAMASEIHPISGLTYLKHSYFLFMRVFIFYLVFAAFCLLIQMFGHTGGLVNLLVSMSPYSGQLEFLLVKGAFVAVYTGYFFLLIQLKSFVFNMYHAVMTALRWFAQERVK